jgi:hypothetical protein
MLDFSERRDCVWDEALKPIGEGTFDKKPFADWWERNQKNLTNLDPLIAEQWIYRHWSLSYTSFLRLKLMTWCLAAWPSAQILRNVHLEFGTPMEPDLNYRVFNCEGAFGPLPTARALNQGTWDIPLLALETPNGIRSAHGEMPEVRFVVAEGSKRMRYLNALRHRGAAPGPHELFILESPDAR